MSRIPEYMARSRQDLPIPGENKSHRQFSNWVAERLF
jgi:hypothetical protein